MSARTTPKPTKATKQPKAAPATPQGAAALAAVVPQQETVQQLPRDKCHLSQRNTRQPTVKEVTEAGLVESMKTTGQKTPGIVRPFPGKPGHYEIGAGNRRYVAGGPAGLTTFPAIVREMDDAEFDTLILVENFQREDPGPKAEAIVLQRLHDQGVRTVKEVAAALGRPEHWVKRRLQLLKVIPALQKEWQKGEIDHFNVEMMELLGSLPKDTQEQLARDLDDNWNVKRAESRRDLEVALRRSVLCSLQGVTWLDDPDTFVKGCGPGCSHDSTKSPGLFDDGTEKQSCGTCLNSSCFFARQSKARAKEYSTLTAGEDLPVVTGDWSLSDRGVDLGQKELVKAKHVYDTDLVPAKEKSAKLLSSAMKVLYIAEGGALSIRYLKPASKGSGSSGSGDAKDIRTPKQKEKERKEAHQAKRWVVVLERLRKALKEAPYTSVVADGKNPGIDRIITLVAHYGLPWSHTFDSKAVWKRVDEGTFLLNAHPNKGEKKDTTDQLEMLWHGLKEILDRNFSYHRVIDTLTLVPHMERVAALIAYDLTGEKTRVDLEIPPPKSWGPTDPHTLEPITTQGAATSVAGSSSTTKKAASPAAKKTTRKK